ncbi:hypothetical protein M0804_009293 [Polistes exclamans]|nr:hypothetical protein M0804_009293 [Polistes exclamans]
MEGEDEIEVLLPCAICGRTFMPRSLEKHFKICERGAIKKRKPFDSAKQRIQGTDLAEFLPRQEKKRYSNDEKRKSCWKETHDDFLRTIRAARSETASMVINQRQSISHASSGAPTRANEKGMCPTCGRQFGIKAYDRHVAWCKERSTRLPISPATKNIAKERLEARMKYRAPALKNRRQSNRDKYSQSCTTVNKTPNKVREIVSVPEHNTREKIKENLSDTQRPSTTGRGEQLNNTETTYQLGKTKETTIKRNPTDRPTSCSRSIIPQLRNMNLPLLISLKPKKKSEGKIIQYDDAIQYSTRSDKIKRTMMEIKKLENNQMTDDHSDGSYNNYTIDRTIECEKKNRNTIKIGHAMITARNQKDSKVNDITVNDNILEMIVQPCNIYNNNNNNDYNIDDTNDELITWEEMKMNRCEKSNNRSDTNINDNVINEIISSEKCHQHIIHSSLQSDNKSFDDEDKNDREMMIPLMEDLFIKQDDISFIENDPMKMITWSNTIQQLNQTYLIKDSDDRDILMDTNVTQDSHDNNNNNNNDDDDDDLTVGSISIQNDHHEINREINHANVKINNENIDHDLTFNNCNLTEAKTIIYPIEKYDKVVENVINDNHNDELFYTDIVIENNVIDDNIVILSSLSEIENVINDTKNLSVENIKLNEMNLTLSEDKVNNVENKDHSNFVKEYIDKNDSYKSRGSVDQIDTKSEQLHNIYENYTNERFKYSTEEEEEEEEENDDEEDEENVDHKKSTIIDRKDYENNLKRSLTIHSKTPTIIRSIKINSKIQENMNLLRGSTNTLISSIEENDYVNNKRYKNLNSISKIKDNNVNKLSDRIEYHYEKSNKLPEIIKRDISTNKNEHYYLNDTLTLPNDRAIINNNVPILYNYKQLNNRLHKRNPKIRILPPVLIDSSSSSSQRIQRSSNSSNRPLWSNYIRRRPDFNLVLRCRIGGGGDTCKEYDPFLLAERQMNDLLSDSSDLSLTEIPSTSSNKSHSFPLSHSSAFVKYPPYQCKTINHLEKSITNEYDELTSDFSTDSTETNSISHELFIQELNDKKQLNDRENKMMNKELARRMILDEPSSSIALENDIDHRDKSISINHHHRHQQQQQYKNDISNKILDKGGGGGGFSSTKISKSQFNKSQNVRAYSAPKSIYQRKIKHCNVKDNDNKSMVVVKLDNNNIENDYLTYSNSDLDLHSIVSSSSEIDMMKRSNSVFDQLINSLDDDDIVGNDSFPSLRSLLRNESLRTSSSNHHGTTVVHDDNNQFNNGQISDEEFSSTDNYKQQDNKINADSAYSSLNRKYSNHHGGRSNSSSSNTGGGNNETTNLMGDNLMVSRNNIRRENNQSAISKTKCRMSRFCHECGSRFPETAKYCCQCGIKRLAL